MVLRLCVLQGVQYRDMLRVDDLSLDVVPQQISNDSFTGGYASVSAARMML